MSGILYKLDFASGKSYIGITKRSLRKRIQVHFCDSRNGSDLLVHRAWRKHGAPKIMVLAIVEESILLDTEKRAVFVYGTMKPRGYNMTYGGETPPTTMPEFAIKSGLARRGMKFTEQHKSRISESLKGVQNWLGKKHSEETKAKMKSTARSIYRQYEYGGEKMCLQDWADRLGVKRQALWNRIHRDKWPLELALSTGPVW